MLNIKFQMLASHSSIKSEALFIKLYKIMEAKHIIRVFYSKISPTSTEKWGKILHAHLNKLS